MMSSTALIGKVVVVVGARSPIGTVVAQVAHAAGATVVRTSRTPDTRSGELRMDLADEASIAAAADQVGACDHVVCLAAARSTGGLDTLNSTVIHDALDAKVVGPMLLAKHLRRRWRHGGSLTIVSGIADERPTGDSLVMSTVNGTVNTMVRALAVDLAPIRVNAISPGAVDTGLRTPQELAAIAARSLTGSASTPHAVAEAILLLALNPSITGSVLTVDGGQRLT